MKTMKKFVLVLFVSAGVVSLQGCGVLGYAALSSATMIGGSYIHGKQSGAIARRAQEGQAKAVCAEHPQMSACEKIASDKK